MKKKKLSALCRVQWHYWHKLNAKSMTERTKRGIYHGDVRHTCRHWKKRKAVQMAKVKWDGNMLISQVPLNELSKEIPQYCLQDTREGPCGQYFLEGVGPDGCLMCRDIEDAMSFDSMPAATQYVKENMESLSFEGTFVFAITPLIPEELNTHGY